jgi:hypothetical protein
MVGRKCDTPPWLSSIQSISLITPISISFNRLDLPEYESYHQLLEKLSFAIENTTGFALE